MHLTKASASVLLSLFLVLGFTGIGSVPVFGATTIGGTVPPSPSETLHFKLQVVPTIVPADGGTYVLYIFLVDPSDQPAAAPSDTQVSLFSSDQTAGSVQSTVTISHDTSYASATFTSTTTPGSTVLTALASGIGSGTLTVATQVPVGYPSSIALFSLPSSLIPGGGETGGIVVQLQDPTGAPARAPSAITVGLTSSNPNVVSVPATLTIPQGTTYAVAEDSPTNVPGTALISGSASGFLTGVTSESVAGPSPASIEVSLLPSIMPADPTATGVVAVSLLDINGFPARANQSITVVLTSSNLGVAYFSDPYLVITAGSFYAMKTITSGGGIGVSQITAQSSGLASGSAKLAGKEYGNPSDLDVIEIEAGPSSVLPDGSTYANVVSAQLLNDTDGFPVQSNVSSPTVVYFSSSNALVGTVNGSSIVAGGLTYATTTYTSTLLVGTTTITAAADGFANAQLAMANSAPPPTKIAIGLASTEVRATGESYPLIYVQLQDDNGNPAKASQDTQVFLTPNSTGATDHYVVIHSGSSYAVANLYSSTSPGSVNITASGTGFAPVWTVVTTVEPFPSTLAVYTGLEPMQTDGSNHQVFVQLLDAEGRPAKPETPISVFLTTDTPSVATVANSLTLGSGASVASAALTLVQPGTATVTAIAQGYTSASTSVVVSALPLTEIVAPSSTSYVVGSSYQFAVNVSSGIADVAGATVTGSALNGTFTTSSTETNSLGGATLVYSPKAPGTDNLTFTAAMPGFSTATASLTVKVDAYYTVTAKVVDESSAGLSGILVTLVDAKGDIFNGTSGSDGTVVFNNVFWGNATISVPPVSHTATATYTLTSLDSQSAASTSVPVLSSLTVTAQYQTSYLVSVISAYGTTAGSGSFNKGATGSASVSPTSVSSGFLTSKDFNGWAGTYSSKKATFTFTITGPTVLTATWVTNMTGLYILVVVIAVIAVAVVGLFWFIRRRRTAEEAEPEKEEEFK